MPGKMTNLLCLPRDSAKRAAAALVPLPPISIWPGAGKPPETSRPRQAAEAGRIALLRRAGLEATLDSPTALPCPGGR